MSLSLCFTHLFEVASLGADGHEGLLGALHLLLRRLRVVLLLQHLVGQALLLLLQQHHVLLLRQPADTACTLLTISKNVPRSVT